MDCNCNCFGIAASSRKPIKRYNLLVPEIFPKTSPPFQERLDASTERKLKKLFEYVEKNPNRAPKISRRLARRIEKGLYSNQQGFVQIASEAYIYLLDRLGPDGSSLFAKEVISEKVARPTHFYQGLVPSVECLAPRADSSMGSDLSSMHPLPPSGSPELSVTGQLLRSADSNMQCLGVRLLTTFIKQQVSAEYLAHVEILMEQLMLINKQTNQRHVLLAQQEYVNFCARTSSGCRLMQPLVDQLLTQWTAAQVTQAGTDGMKTDAALIGNILQSLGQLSQGPSHDRGFFEAILQHVDKTQGWDPSGGPSNAPAIQLMREVYSDEQQQYQAYGALIHHAANSQLPEGMRTSVVSTASREGQSLPTVLSSAALILAVRELVPWMQSLTVSETVSLTKTKLLEAVSQLAAALGDKQHLLEALAGIMVKLGRPQSFSQAIREMILAAALSLHSYVMKAAPSEACTVPPVLLQEVSVLALQGDAQQSLFAHELLQLILGTSSIAIRPLQIRTTICTAWHQVSVLRTPADFVAISKSLKALFKLTPAEHHPEFRLLAIDLHHRALMGEQADLESLPVSQRLAIILLAECLRLWLAGASPVTPLLRDTKQLRLIDGELQALTPASDFGTISQEDLESVRALEMTQREYHPPANESKSELQLSDGVSVQDYILPLSELTQRGKSKAGSWFGTGLRARTTDEVSHLPLSNQRPQVKLRVRQRAPPKSAAETEQEVQILLQDLGFLQGGPASVELPPAVAVSYAPPQQKLESSDKGAEPIIEQVGVAGGQQSITQDSVRLEMPSPEKMSRGNGQLTNGYAANSLHVPGDTVGAIGRPVLFEER